MSRSPDSSAADSSAANADQLQAYREGWSALSQLIGEGRSFSGYERNCCFLNTQQGRFADVSSATGLDLQDDGRAVAICDWNWDGCPDLWLANRTAPRIRLMQHRGSRAGNFLGVRLRGTTSNRDAIGARVRVVLGDGTADSRTDQSTDQSTDVQPPEKTLRAGDGYLSQSSKWLHFGLGAADAVLRVDVRWPNGQEERFAGLHVNRFYQLTEGSGNAESWQAPSRPVPPEPLPQPLTADSSPKRTLLVEPLLTPKISFQTVDNTPQTLDRFLGRPLLVTLWATDCLPCLDELSDWSRAATLFSEADVEILALSVDRLNASQRSAGEDVEASTWQSMLRRIGFAGTAGEATAQTVSRLDVLRRAQLELQRPLVTPCSFLLTRDGRLSAIYSGRVSAAEVVRDARLADDDAKLRRQAAVPFAGRWASPPPRANPLAVMQGLLRVAGATAARQYALQVAAVAEVKPTQRDNAAPAIALCGELTLAENDVQEAVRLFQLVHAWAPQQRRLHERIGERLLVANEPRAAWPHLALAVDGTDVESRVWFNAGLAALGARQLDEARRCLGEAVRLDDQDVEAHYHYGTALYASGAVRLAIQHFEQALQLRPGWRFAANDLAWILATTSDETVRDGPRAVQLAELANRDPAARSASSLATLAVAHAANGDFAQARRFNHTAGEMADAAGDEPLAGRLRDRQTLFAADRPVVIPAAKTTD